MSFLVKLQELFTSRKFLAALASSAAVLAAGAQSGHIDVMTMLGAVAPIGIWILAQAHVDQAQVIKNADTANTIGQIAAEVAKRLAGYQDPPPPIVTRPPTPEESAALKAQLDAAAAMLADMQAKLAAK